jgi:hypothetical protein
MEDENMTFVFRLERVKDLLEGAFHSEDRALQLASFSTASILIQWLEKSDERYNRDFDSNKAKQLASIRMQFAAMLGLDEMGGMTAEEHYDSASKSIDEMLSSCMV